MLWSCKTKLSESSSGTVVRVTAAVSCDCSVPGVSSCTAARAVCVPSPASAVLSARIVIDGTVSTHTAAKASAVWNSLLFTLFVIFKSFLRKQVFINQATLLYVDFREKAILSCDNWQKSGCKNGKKFTQNALFFPFLYIAFTFYLTFYLFVLMKTCISPSPLLAHA